MTAFRNAALIFTLVSLLFALTAGIAGAGPAEFYVSPQGKDSNFGDENAPFATLERARDAIRDLKQTGNITKEGVVVWVRGGVYPRDHTFELTDKDSASPDMPIVYRAYKDETPRIIGGKTISGFTPVADPAVLARLTPEAQKNVLQADLKAQGITVFGKMTRRAQGPSYFPTPLELFFQGKPMQIARWPNAGEWTTIAAVPAGPNGGKFTYDSDRPLKWKTSTDIWVHGYWTWDWADSYENILTIDPQKREIATVPPHGAYGYTAGKRFYFLNVLEELDSPGEYFLDRNSGILYFWPPAPPKAGDAMVSLFDGPLLRLNGASGLVVRGLTFECSRSSGILVEGGEKNLIAGCVLRNLGTIAAQFQQGKQNGISGCDIYDVGEGGVELSGGDRAMLIPAGLFAENCRFTRYNRWARCYAPAVRLDGVGNRVSHCLIYDAPHNAIQGGGNDHLIEFNDIHHVCQETSDAGAFYMGRDLTQRGTVIRYNYFHENGDKKDVNSVYLDDCFCGTTIFGNVFYKTGRGVMIGGGRDNTVENNIFVDCNPSIHVDARGTSWASKYFVENGEWRIFETLRAVNPTKPPYSVRYPQLVKLMQDEPAKAKGNKIVRNISVGGTWLNLLDGLTDREVEVRDNMTTGDPGFIARDKQDFRLNANSPAFKLGFKPIPLDEVGLIQDEYRADAQRAAK